MEDKKTKHTKTDLLAIYQEKKFEKKYFSNFAAYYHLCFDELYQDMKNYSEDDFEPGDSIQASALSISIEYIESFIESINQGYGEVWAHEMAHTNEDVDRAAFSTYHQLKYDNQEQADKELRIYCKSLGGDENFEKQYLYLVENLENPDCIIEKATTYSEAYKQQIKKGRSEKFAHQYAFLLADDYNEIYCEDYAIAYEQAIIQNKSVEYAELYADKYASALVNIKRRYGISDDEDLMNFAIAKVDAYIFAWEYAQKNPFKDFNQFAHSFENEYINTFFSDHGRPKGSVEEINNKILKRVLAKLEIYN